jgi:protein SCO1
MEEQDNNKPPLFRILISVILALTAIGVWTLYLSEEKTPSAAENSRALIGGSFELTNHMNKPVTDKDFLGKYMLVYFGYTYCPDVCPMDLQILADSVRNLSPEHAEQLNPVFVSVDPERDTVDVMAEYVQFFHKDLIGLTGTSNQVEVIKKAYRVYASKADDSENYLVDHTAYTYFMDKDGTILKHFNHGEDPEEMAAQMALFIK